MGTPAVGIMTSAFVDGAELMATALGVPGYRFAVIDHPIAASTDSELADKADVTLEQAYELLQLDTVLDPHGPASTAT